MIIANPIYDVVFKRLMENEQVARFFISTLLDEEVISVNLKPQEFTYFDKDKVPIAIFRLDFVATIKTKENEHKKVLIEIQKARSQTDLMRFRNYLAEQYKREDTIDGKKMVLPITTIYILGFKLYNIESACVKVRRQYHDLINNTIIKEKNEFIEQLTHDSFVVQVERISNRYKSRLDKLLSVFEQSNFADDRGVIKEFNHDTDIEEVKIMADILHHTGINPTERKQIEDEQEAWRTIDEYTDGKLKSINMKLADAEKLLNDNALKIDNQAKELNTQAKEIDNQAKELDNQAKELDEKEKEMKEKEIALKEKDIAMSDLEKQIEDLKKRLGE